jgi:hypothetical protein
MKKLFPLISALMLFTLLLIGCENEEPLIVYPASGDFGTNLLTSEGTDVLTSGDGGSTIHYYSMRAELPEETSLKIIMKNKSGTNSPAVWYYNMVNQGLWNISNYISGSQEFHAATPGTYDMQLYFVFSGSADIEFYENGSTEPTRVETISW